jgi:translation initiation factor 5B
VFGIFIVTDVWHKTSKFQVDRLYGWEKSKNAPIRKTMMQQTGDVVKEFKMRLNRVQNQFQEQGLNSMLYYKNREMGETISILPASAIRSEMFLLSPNFSLT